MKCKRQSWSVYRRSWHSIAGRISHDRHHLPLATSPTASMLRKLMFQFFTKYKSEVSGSACHSFYFVTTIDKWKNHFSEMKGDVGISPH